MMKKRTILVVAGFIIIIAVSLTIFLVVRRRQLGPIPEIGSPDIPSSIEGALPIEAAINENDFKDFPGELPILNIERTSLSRDAAINIAQKAGFTTDPIETTDILEGKIYIWSGDIESLAITLKTQEIKYNLNEPDFLVQGNLTDEETIGAAVSFLRERFPEESQYIKPINVTYFKTGGEEKIITSDRSVASLFQVVFTPAALNYPIIALNPLNPGNFVEVLADGTIASAQLKKTLEIREGETKYGLIKPADVLKSLPNAKLMNVIGGYIDIRKLTNTSFEKIIISKVELAYYEEGGADFYQPIFKFTGLAKIKGVPDELTAIFYLPALSQL